MQVASVEGQPSLSCDTPTSLEACNLTTLVLPLCHVMPLIADSFVLSQLPPSCAMVPAPPCALNPLVCVLALALVALLALQARSMQVASVEGQPLSCDTPTSLEACLCSALPLYIPLA